MFLFLAYIIVGLKIFIVHGSVRSNTYYFNNYMFVNLPEKTSASSYESKFGNAGNKKIEAEKEGSQILVKL
jgi:hypothetical protein